MSRLSRCFLLALVVVASWGCGDGGPVGSGISAVSGISGNIAEVDNSSGQVQTGAGVTVTVVGIEGAHTVSDSDGSFEIRGQFSGPVTLRFATTDVSATRDLDVPAGSSVVLEDLKINAQGVSEGARRILGFVGQVAMVDCADATLLVNDQRPPAHQFLVRLSASSVLMRANGETIRCANINSGNQIAVEGLIRLDRTIDALAVILGPPRPGTPAPIQEVRLHGALVSVNCPSGMLLIDDGSSRTRLRLVPMTVLVDEVGQPIGCDGLMRNDSIDGSGLINTRRPGVIEAKRLRRQSTAIQP